MLYAPQILMPNGYASTGWLPLLPKLARKLVASPGRPYPHGIICPSPGAVAPLRAAFSHSNTVGKPFPRAAQYAAASTQLTSVTG